MTKTFTNFAGQLVQDGISTNYPLTSTLEENQSISLASINGLMPKVGKVFIEDTRIFGDPFGGVVQRIEDRFGAGIEVAGFIDGVDNKKRDGSYMPNGTQSMESYVHYVNWAYNADVKIYDREVDLAVLDAETAGKYMAEKLKLPMKTVAQNHYGSWKMILSDVIDGTRSISSYTVSSGTGTAVTYAPTAIEGYCGMIGTESYVIPAPVAGTLTTVTASAALGFVETLEGIAADMKFESTAFVKDGAINTFVQGTPLLFAETKSLNAMDVAWANDGSYKGFPTVSARDYLRKFCNIVEIDAFPALPTNATYSTYRLGAVMIDPSALREVVKYADVESMRDCVNRATGYNYQGASIMGISKLLPSYAMLVKSA